MKHMSYCVFMLLKDNLLQTKLYYIIVVILVFINEGKHG